MATIKFRSVKGFTVIAITQSGARKVVAEGLSAFKATKLAADVEAKGFGVEVIESKPKVIALRD